jgi:hypothetical protein
MIDTVIRTHVRNEKRLELLKRTIQSAKDKKLYTLGGIYVLDDGSPLKDRVRSLCYEMDVDYIPATLKPGDTKNGLAESLAVGNWTAPVFAVCDDVVFGRDILEELNHIVLHELPLLPDCGMVSLFACYSRMKQPHADSHLWEYPVHAFYAGIAVVYTPKFRDAYYNWWVRAVNEELPMPQMCDDIFCKVILDAHGLKLYNTIQDYAQHTGIDARTFGDKENDPGSHYLTQFFVGE